MEIQKEYPIIDGLFESWQVSLGRDFLSYRNHVYRVFNLAVFISEAKGNNIEKIAIAAAFHDIGIWLDKTFDYLMPSFQHAQKFLSESNNEEWSPEIEGMIVQHHKVTPWHGKGQDLVEAFRRADWIDVAFFALPTKVPRRYLSELLLAFPRMGFHRRLLELTIWWAKRHPFRPLPMLKL